MLFESYIVYNYFCWNSKLGGVYPLFYRELELSSSKSPLIIWSIWSLIFLDELFYSPICPVDFIDVVFELLDIWLWTK